MRVESSDHWLLWSKSENWIEDFKCASEERFVQFSSNSAYEFSFKCLYNDFRKIDKVLIMVANLGLECECLEKADATSSYRFNV